MARNTLTATGCTSARASKTLRMAVHAAPYLGAAFLITSAPAVSPAHAVSRTADLKSLGRAAAIQRIVDDHDPALFRTARTKSHTGSAHLQEVLAALTLMAAAALRKRQTARNRQLAIACELKS